MGVNIRSGSNACLPRGVQSILAKLLAPPMPTVAAVTGHAFGGGAMLGMAHDWRVMRTDRGYCPKPAW